MITDAEWEELLALAETANCACEDFVDRWREIKEREDGNEGTPEGIRPLV